MPCYILTIHHRDKPSTSNCTIHSKDIAYVTRIARLFLNASAEHLKVDVSHRGRLALQIMRHGVAQAGWTAPPLGA